MLLSHLDGLPDRGRVVVTGGHWVMSLKGQRLASSYSLYNS